MSPAPKKKSTEDAPVLKDGGGWSEERTESSPKPSSRAASTKPCGSCGGRGLTAYGTSDVECGVCGGSGKV